MVVGKIKDLVQKESGELKGDRERDQLSVDLGNQESRVRGISSKTGWKCGFPKDKA